VKYTDFDTLKHSFPARYDEETGTERIDLSSLGAFPTVDLTSFTMFEQGLTRSATTNEALRITDGETLHASAQPFGPITMDAKALSVSTVGPKLELSKRVLAVNGMPYSADTLPAFGATLQRDIDVLFELSNRGTTLAENVVMNVNPGPYFEPLAASMPPNCTLDDGNVRASCGSLLPGETRAVVLRYTARDAACAVVYDSSTLTSSMTAAFSGTYSFAGRYVEEQFTVPDAGSVELPAYDFRADRLSCSSQQAVPGQLLKLTANIMNGAAAAEEVRVGFFAIVNDTDTLLLSSQNIAGAGKNTATVVSAEVQVPENAHAVKFLVAADPANGSSEFCELNNVQSLELPLCGSDWIIDASAYPNPARGPMRFTYLLPRDMKNVTLTIYSLDGRALMHVNTPPGSVGRHEIPWDLSGLATGTYVFTFEGDTMIGEHKSFSGKVVRVE
jgi:hypothetical protein